MRMPSNLLFIALGLAGCAGRHVPATYGNFIDVPAQLDEKVMADDVVRKITVLYPPAHTSFTMQQATPDAFGATLTAALRSKGYALAEFDPRPLSAKPTARESARSPATGNLALTYLVDQPMEAGLYRVTVLINDQSLSRLYQARDGSLVPAGYWMRKE